LQERSRSSASRVSYAWGARREASDGESPPAPGPRNLGWWSTTCRVEPPRGLQPAACPGRKARAGVSVAQNHPDPVVGMADGFNPIRRFSSQPSASWGRRVDELGAGIGRSRGCARGLQLVAEVDERHLVQVSHRGGQPLRRALGLAYRPRARYGEGVSEAGSRRQSRGHGGGLSMILRAARAVLAGERALVEGRRPGVGEAVVFDETAAEAVPGGLAGEIQPKGRIVSRGVATEGVRGHVTSSARGRKRRSREVQRGGAFDRSSARTAWHHELTPARSGQPGRAGVAGCGKAEAGGSPSSEASPGGAPEAIGRRWAGVIRRVGRSARAERRGGERTPESGSLQGARIVGRLQKSVRRIFLASVARRRRDSLKRPAIL